MALLEAGVRSNFRHLFDLYGIHELEDLKLVDEKVLDELEIMIQKNDFIGLVDLTKEKEQEKYLGRRWQLLDHFKFSVLDRMKLKEKLPVAVEKVQSICEASSFKSLKRLARNTEKTLGQESLSAEKSYDCLNISPDPQLEFTSSSQGSQSR